MKKALLVIYGVIAYMIFLITFLYAIGFVGNLIVPKSIDSGPESPLLISIFINILLLSIFALQHSIMARPAFKKWWTKIVGVTAERSTYVLFSSLALILLYWQWRPIPLIVWQVDNETFALLLKAIFFSGWIIVLLSSFMINHFELFGLKQVFTAFKNFKSQSPTFQVNYLYKFIRYPIMLGFLIAFWATPIMTLGHLLFSIATTSYIIIAVKYLEEKDLQKYLGKDYNDYQQKVPMFFPHVKFQRKPRLKPHVKGLKKFQLKIRTAS